MTDPEGDATTTPGGSLLVHLGRAIAAAAGEGRADVAGELAALVGRLAGEGRAEALEARGVAVLGRPSDGVGCATIPTRLGSKP